MGGETSDAPASMEQKKSGYLHDLLLKLEAQVLFYFGIALIFVPSYLLSSHLTDRVRALGRGSEKDVTTVVSNFVGLFRALVGVFYVTLSLIASYTSSTMKPSDTIKIARCLLLFHFGVLYLLITKALISPVDLDPFRKLVTYGLVVYHALLPSAYVYAMATNHPPPPTGAKKAQ